VDRVWIGFGGLFARSDPLALWQPNTQYPYRSRQSRSVTVATNSLLFLSFYDPWAGSYKSDADDNPRAGREL